MASSLKNISSLIAAPLLTAGFLCGIAADRAQRTSPLDVEPYQHEAQEAIGLQPNGPEGKVPHFVTHKRNGKVIGEWVGKDQKIPDAAQQLLKPNGILNREYVFNPSSNVDFDKATLLIVQCRDSRDMLGHYPPVCYRAFGEEQTGAKVREIRVGSTMLPLVEYEFSRSYNGRKISRKVYNFLIVPGRGVVRDMESLREASEYYGRRAYGAAQFQIVLSPDISSLDESTRDEIFQTLIAPNVPLINLLAYPKQVNP